MLAALCAALLAAASSTDTVVTRDGARITGTVVEENPNTGITIRAPDGTIRQYTREQVARVEFADGTVSRWDEADAREGAPLAQAAPAPAPAPPPAAPRARDDQPVDTIFFIGGGRARGTVLEDSPREGVTFRLLDGTVRRYARREISRIEYADGTVARRREPPEGRRREPPPAYTPPPPTYAPPPPQAPAYVPERPHRRHRYAGTDMDPFPIWGAIGVGGTFFGGEAEQGVDMRDNFASQVHVGLEGGLRLSPEIGLGLYMDVGAGDPARPVRDAFCSPVGVDCTATAGRIGFLLRHTWDPSSPAAKWMTLGTGWEFAAVNEEDAPGETEVFTYTGREYVRLGAGVDFRQNPVLGVGFYGSVALGEYHRLEVPEGRLPMSDALHTTVQVGVRLTLFP